MLRMQTAIKAFELEKTGLELNKVRLISQPTFI